ncbi:hypothetical protein ALC57_09476 [Trachymyrmex cornetzi]|uniref:Uncharacterized protein n=1 Tax=Trachymyrmex cornetzi TaxID=471704 RepID=A0A151J5P6_9HYME|nr:hypothetical protein ALC57_09476 [Trachymyrmex cornetzi]
MSGQYGASHTSVTLYHTSKYGTGEGRHTRSRFNDSSPPNIFIRQETREQSGGGGARGRRGYIYEYTREKRASRGRQARLRIPTRGPATAGPTDSGMPRGQLARNNNAAGKHTCLENSAQSDIYIYICVCGAELVEDLPSGYPRYPAGLACRILHVPEALARGSS